MMIGISALMFVSAALFFWLYARAKKGTLPLNSVAGFRTDATMASEEVWRYVHQKYASSIAIAGLGLLCLGVVTAAGAIVKGDINDMSNSFLGVFIVVLVILLLVIVVSGVKANRDAKQFNKEKRGSK